MRFRSALLAVLTLILVLAGALLASGQSHLVPVVTDQTPLALSNKFGAAGAAELNQRGDYAFIGAGSSALFLRRAGAATPVRILQMLDEAPGYPGSRVDLIGQVKMNESGVIAVRAEFASTSGVIQGVIYVYDGVSLRKVAAGPDPAPGGNGATYERAIGLVGFNDAGDVAFTAPLAPTNAGIPGNTTLYIVPAGGSALRVAGLGDLAPGLTHGETFSVLSTKTLNNLGDVLFAANLAGGLGGTGLFVATKNGALRKVVANGDPDPRGGTFASPGGGLLNNAGQVTFFANSAIWLASPDGSLERVAAAGDAVPSPVGGTLGGNPNGNLSNPLAFNDAGVVLFNSPVRSSTTTGFGLFRARVGNPPLDVVAHMNESAPGTSGLNFGSFSAYSMNAAGVVTFRTALRSFANETGSYAIYRQPGTVSTPPALVVMDGQPSPLGGTYSLFNSSGTKLLDSGAVYTWADLPGASADFAEVLVSQTETRILSSTGEDLPPGSRISLRGFQPGASGDLVGTAAQRTGGRWSLLLHDTRARSTNVILSDGDAAPWGGVIRLQTTSTVFIDAGGNIVFRALVVGGPQGLSAAIVRRAPGGQLQKLFATGEVEPTTGRYFNSLSMSGLLPRPFNDAGQVVFAGGLVGIQASPAGLFVTRAGAGPVKVAIVGEAAPGGGTFSTFPTVSAVSINQAGHVLFLAGTSDGTVERRGIYFWTPGSGVSKVARAGDVLPAGMAFTDFSFPALNNLGEVAFLATLQAPRGGVFAGPASGPLTLLALDGQPAPAGGTYAISVARPDITMNDAGDVVFRVELSGGGSNSGYFVRRGRTGAVHALMLQGQPAPGTTGVFPWIATTLNNYLAESFRLDESGDVAVQGIYEETPGIRSPGIWHVKPDDAIEPIVLRGKITPEFDGVAVITNVGNAWNSGQRFPLWARVSGGWFDDGIFLFVPLAPETTPAGTNVVVQPKDATTGATPVTVTFATVTAAGNTTLTTSAGGPPLGSAFSLGIPAVYYNLETTAKFSGPITVCIDTTGITFPVASTLALLHFEDDAWVDVTTSRNGPVMCGHVDSLSPFLVARFNPQLSVTATPALLWPPNDKLIQVTASLDLEYTCDAHPVVQLVSITSNEPLGSGDVRGAVPGTDSRRFQLRAARLGTGQGRVYTIIYRATDSCGTAVGTAQVLVPHDLGIK
jgi:hypothetical protein